MDQFLEEQKKAENVNLETLKEEYQRIIETLEASHLEKLNELQVTIVMIDI